MSALMAELDGDPLQALKAHLKKLSPGDLSKCCEVLDPSNRAGNTDLTLTHCAKYFYGAEMSSVHDMMAGLSGIIETGTSVLMILFTTLASRGKFDLGDLRRIVENAMSFKLGQSSSSAAAGMDM